ncbi:hypothetical protein HPB51_025786 [Rhipicephalus microplus]|uniref:Uncharacterized protein n=1 Tax=Rhipicephalus microplus TaxID=6941 RepID=A0A9J6EKF2_RHIMP|nr:hypothetical protein HPB51_025786 [Rhipicephalus microplus]
MKVNLDMGKARLDFLESKVKIDHLGDDLPWHAGEARPQANQKCRAWQKAAPGHDAAAKLDGPSSLKMAREFQVLAAKVTSGYLEIDLTPPAKEAALGPLKKLSPEQVWCVDSQKMRNITLEDFRTSLKKVRCSM